MEIVDVFVAWHQSLGAVAQAFVGGVGTF